MFAGCVHNRLRLYPFSDLEPLTEAQPAGTLLITHARLFDGSEHNPILLDQDIYLENGVIAKIGPHPLNVNADKTLNAEGQTVMPGMIDFHVHVGGTEAPWRPTFYSPERTLSAYLAFGVTSVVDMGGIPNSWQNCAISWMPVKFQARDWCMQANRCQSRIATQVPSLTRVSPGLCPKS